MPEVRRFYAPIIPVLILSAVWYGRQMRDLAAARYRTHWAWFLALGTAGVAFVSLYLAVRVVFGAPGASVYISAVVGYLVTLTMIGIGLHGRRDEAGSSEHQLARYVGPAIGALAIVYLSLGSLDWWTLSSGIAGNLSRGETRVLEYAESTSYLSMKASFDELNPLIADCDGVMSLEHTFIAAFMDTPVDRVYDIMEIPPFGRLGESDYDGLRPDRIDCVLVSERLTTAIGHGTNIRIRYANYIEPYVEQLREMGAATHEVERFGQVIILEDSG